MLANSGHTIYNTLRDNPSFSRFSYDILSDTLSNIVDILAKKLPQEVNFNPAKLEAVIHKIKLVPIPRTVVEEDFADERGLVQANTGERAIVRLRIPMKKIEKED
jgi:hypothetical protein